jgi:RHS repeat-associated protein
MDGKPDYGNPYLFTGRRVDMLDEGSLTIQYNRNRYYDYYTGRWTTHDPLGYVDGMNLYEYVSANPVVRSDPQGKRAKPCTLSLYSQGDGLTISFVSEIIKRGEFWWSYSIQGFNPSRLDNKVRKAAPCCCCYNVVKIYDHGTFSTLADGTTEGKQRYGWVSAKRSLQPADIGQICPWLCKITARTELVLLGCYVGMGDRKNFQKFFNACSAIKVIRACRGKVTWNSSGFVKCFNGWAVYRR